MSHIDAIRPEFLEDFYGMGGDISSPGGMESSHPVEKPKPLTPIDGEIVSKLPGYCFELPDFQSQVESAKILDGLKAADPRYDCHLSKRSLFFMAGAPLPEMRETATYPTVGIKIHVILDLDSPTFAEDARQIAELCLQPNTDGIPTTFKIMTNIGRGNALDWGDEAQARKIITIYPGFLIDQASSGKLERTNVPETLRIIGKLREITDKKPINEQAINTERKVGNGVFIRAGALVSEGEKYQKVSSDHPFEEQVTANLDSPETDQTLFQEQIEAAILAGQL